MFVYILASQRNGTLYTGVTNDLVRRVWEHRHAEIDGFSSRYKTFMLVYFERHETPYEAITREKQIKKWYRAWKLRLIEEFNPEWQDFFDEIAG